MKIGDRVFVRGYIDEIRKDTVIVRNDGGYFGTIPSEVMGELTSAQPEEVTPHRNYRYLSDYWCECGWHLGKMGDVNYCPNCGKKVKWDE